MAGQNADRGYAAFLNVGYAFFAKAPSWSKHVRDYTEVDISNLRTCLQKYGLQCEEAVDIESKKELIDKLKELVGVADEPTTRMLFVFIGAYGMPNVPPCIICPDDILNLKDEIERIFSQCQAGVKKEKYVFIQACDRSRCDSTQKDAAGPSVPAGEKLPAQANIVTFCSTIPGKLTNWDVEENGTMAVHSLCGVLENAAAPITLSAAVVRTNERVGALLEQRNLAASQLVTTSGTNISTTPLHKV